MIDLKMNFRLKLLDYSMYINLDFVATCALHLQHRKRKDVYYMLCTNDNKIKLMTRQYCPRLLLLIYYQNIFDKT